MLLLPPPNAAAADDSLLLLLFGFVVRLWLMVSLYMVWRYRIADEVEQVSSPQRDYHSIVFPACGIILFYQNSINNPSCVAVCRSRVTTGK